MYNTVLLSDITVPKFVMEKINYSASLITDVEVDYIFKIPEFMRD